ncbi:hypothetical protein BGX23_004327, partial [Mortierella sp. AD031]
ILLLRSRIDRMERFFEERFNEDDPEITSQAALQYYRPKEYDITACPTTAQRHGAQGGHSQLPKNVYMDKYTAPKVPQIVTSNLKFDKKHDGQIREFQERCAELTRPVDYFYHQFRKLQRVDHRLLKPQEILDISVNFAVLMREHLGGMAVKMHETRMSNVREAAGANFEEDSLHMFDPQTFHDHAKSIRTLQSFFKTKTAPDNRRDNGGQGNNNNNGQATQGQNGHNSNKNWSNNQDRRRSQNRSGRSYNNNNNSRSTSSFHRSTGQRRGNSQQRGRSTSRRDDRSPRSEGGSKDS